MANIIFIQNSWFDLHGLMYTSGLLKQNGHKSQLFIEPSEKNLIELLRKLSPDFVGFSLISIERLWALEWAYRVKKELNATTIFGGIDPTVCPDLIEHHSVDIVCRGEGEFALLELMDKFEATGEVATDIQNLWLKKNGKVIKNSIRPLVEDLDTLLPIDRDLYYNRYKFLKNYPIKRFMIGRGCPFNCAYCCNKILRDLYLGKGRYIRRHSVYRIIEEIKRVEKKFGIKMIDFIDDDFISDKQWLQSFLERYSNEIKLPFSCLVRIDLVDEEVAALLKQSGCTTVSFGIESANEALRKNILEKRLSDDAIFHGASLLRKHGLRMNAYNMLNIPGETLEDGFQTVNLNVKIKTDFPWCSIFQPFPGTKYWDSLITNKSLNENTRLTAKLNFYSSSLVHQKDSRSLMNLEKLFFCAVKFPFLQSVIRRLVRFPPNKIFQYLFLIAFAYRHSRANNISIWEEIKFNMRHTRNYFKSGKINNSI